MPVQLLDVPDKIDKCDFLLKWKETRHNGAPITKYPVYQRTVNGNGEVQLWKRIHSSLQQEYHVLNLKRGKVYEFNDSLSTRMHRARAPKFRMIRKPPFCLSKAVAAVNPSQSEPSIRFFHR